MQQVAKLKNVQLRTRRYTYKGLINTVRCIYGYAYVCSYIYTCALRVKKTWGPLWNTLSLPLSSVCVCEIVERERGMKKGHRGTF